MGKKSAIINAIIFPSIFLLGVLVSYFVPLLLKDGTHMNTSAGTTSCRHAGDEVSQSEVVTEAKLAIATAEILLNLIKLHKAESHDIKYEETLLYGELVGLLVAYPLVSSNPVKHESCEVVHKTESVVPKVLRGVAEDYPNLKASIDQCRSYFQ